MGKQPAVARGAQHGLLVAGADIRQIEQLIGADVVEMAVRAEHHDGQFRELLDEPGRPAGRTLDADELVQYLDGRLGDRFIAATDPLPPAPKLAEPPKPAPGARLARILGRRHEQALHRRHLEPRLDAQQRGDPRDHLAGNPPETRALAVLEPGGGHQLHAHADAEHGAAHCLAGIGRLLEVVENDIVRRVIRLADFLKDHAALTLDLVGGELEDRLALQPPRD